jgi:hypothetical protein
LSTFAFYGGECGTHLGNLNIKRDMAAKLSHGADAPLMPKLGLDMEYPSITGVISQSKASLQKD